MSVTPRKALRSQRLLELLDEKTHAFYPVISDKPSCIVGTFQAGNSYARMIPSSPNWEIYCTKWIFMILLVSSFFLETWELPCQYKVRNTFRLYSITVIMCSFSVLMKRRRVYIDASIRKQTQDEAMPHKIFNCIERTITS